MSREIFFCKCGCGGNVRGVKDFSRLFTWCTKCTPIQKVSVRKINEAIAKLPCMNGGKK